MCVSIRDPLFFILYQFVDLFSSECGDYSVLLISITFCHYIEKIKCLTTCPFKLGTIRRVSGEMEFLKTSFSYLLNGCIVLCVCFYAMPN